MGYMLEIQNIHKTFNPGTINEKVALNGVNLNLNPGDFVTIIGGNGAGKSTTLNAIAGVWSVDEGKIIIDGVDITKLSEHKRALYLGRVFQDPMTGTAATMSIEENMAIAARRGERRGLGWGITKKERERYKEALKELDLGLEDRLSSKVGLLSGGQRQAITLLMASLKKPKLLLLDEHTAALDPKTAAKVLAISDKIIQEHQLTAMMVTHNMKDAIVHGNRLIMMHEGHVIYDVAGDEKKSLTVADLLHLEKLVVGIVRGHGGCGSRPALGEQIHRGEGLQRADGRSQDDDQQLGDDGWQRDHAELLPPVRAVKPGCLIQFRIDSLQARHENHNRIAQLNPHEDEHQYGQCAVGASQPVMLQRPQSDLGEHRIDSAVFWSKDPPHDDCGDRDRQQLRKIEHCTQEGCCFTTELLLDDVGEQ